MAPPERSGFGRLYGLLPSAIRTSYVARMAVALVLIVVVVGAVGGSIFVQTGAALREDTNDQLQRSTDLQSETLGQWLGLMKEEARLLSRSTVVKSRDNQRIQRFLTTEVEEAGRLPPEVVAVHYLNTSAFVIETSTNEKFVGVNPRQKGVGWAQDPPEFESGDDVWVSPPFESPLSGRPVFAILSPVPGQSDRVLIVMVDIGKRVERLPRPEGGFTQVVNSEGTVVMSHRTDRILSQNAGDAGVDSPAVEAGLAGERGTLTMTMDGTKLLMGYAPVPGTDWVVMSHVPASNAFALRDTITRNLLVLLEEASEDVAESIQEISEGATEQSEDLQEISNTMNDLSATIEEVAASADDVADTARAAADTGERGRAAAEEAVDAMTEIEGRTDTTVREVEKLHDEIEKIGEVVALIEDIAEQTNILALNASIEAARAGEAGEGFAVVADEVKSLAEETKSATEEIEESITQIQEQTEETVEDITGMRESVSAGTDTVEEAIEALEEIVGYVEDTNAGIQEISTATDEQATSTQQAVAMIDEVADISERTTDGAEDVAASAEEQAATTGEVSRSTNELSMKANQLTDILDDFDLDDAGDADTAAEEAPDPAADASGDAAATADGGEMGPFEFDEDGDDADDE
ncbi:MAG: methyl-accepting chemotaxis protein [Halobacteriaceae archaeon]